jgi:transcriptional regulator with XRE-family HTH domain
MRATPEMGIASRLRAARERRGFSREALAYHSGVSWSAIAQVEAGRRTNVRPRTLLALADALGLSIDYLVGGWPRGASMLEHGVLLYDTDAAFVASAAPFLARAIERSEPTLAVTSTANIKSLQKELGTQASAVSFADHRTWYRTPTHALNRYERFLTEAIDAGAMWVRILGEPVWAGRSEPQVWSWACYESLLNLVFRDAPATVLCPYDTRKLDAKVLDHARATHSHAVERGAMISNPKYTEPGMFVLQQ